MIDFIFYLASFFAVLSAINLVLNPNPVLGGLGLVGGFFMIGAIYILARFEFFGVIQVLIYAGAILVLFLFIIMLLDMSKERHGIRMGSFMLISFLVVFSLVVKIISFVSNRIAIQSPSPEVILEMGTIKAFAMILFHDYLLLVHLSGLMLILAVVGAVVLSKKNYFPKPVISGEASPKVHDN